MKYIFFGTPEFAAIILEKLINAGFIPQAVVCNPDKPVGRKKVITAPPVKQRILNMESGIKNKIKILQPEKLEKGLLRAITLAMTEGVSLRAKGEVISTPKHKPDFFIVAAYSKILPKEILEIPRLGVIGVHPSLLPRYRGPSPIQTAILNGDEETGVSLYLMDGKVDHGPVFARQKLEILNSKSEILNIKLAGLSAELLIKTLPKFIKNEITPQPQDENQATFTKKFKTEDVFIEYADLEKAQEQGGEIAVEIYRKIRAMNPEPETYTFINNKRTKLLEAKITGKKLELLLVQPDGKKPINWKNFKNSLN